jgi:hypothetical protein
MSATQYQAIATQFSKGMVPLSIELGQDYSCSVLAMCEKTGLGVSDVPTEEHNGVSRTIYFDNQRDVPFDSISFDIETLQSADNVPAIIKINRRQLLKNGTAIMTSEQDIELFELTWKTAIDLYIKMTLRNRNIDSDIDIEELQEFLLAQLFNADSSMEDIAHGTILKPMY